MSIQEMITDKEEFIKQQEAYIDKEMKDLITFTKHKLRECIESGTFDQYEWMWNRRNFMACSVLMFVTMNDQLPKGMGKEFKNLCKIVKEMHFKN